MFKILNLALVIAATFTALVCAMERDAYAKTENPPGTRDDGPAVIGTLTLRPGALADLTGQCQNTDIVIQNYSIPFDLQTLQTIDLVNYDPANRSEFQVSTSDPIILGMFLSCYPDLSQPFSSLTLAIKSVMKFMPVVDQFGQRTAIITEVVFLRRVPSR